MKAFQNQGTTHAAIGSMESDILSVGTKLVVLTFQDEVIKLKLGPIRNTGTLKSGT